MKIWITKALELLAASLEEPRHELNEIDWKAALSSDKKRLTEHLCAFGNHPGGGFLAFGIEDSGVVSGISNAQVQLAISQLNNLSRAAVEPGIAIDYSLEDFLGQKILIVQIPESSIKPVGLRGKHLEETFIRSGSSTRKASRQEIGTLMLNSRNPRWEDLHASPLLSAEQILAQLDAHTLFKLIERPVPGDAGTLLNWMEEEKLIKLQDQDRGYITNLGAIASAHRLQDFDELSRKAVRVIIYEGLNKGKTRDEIEGQKGYAIRFQGLLNHINTLLPQREVIEQALRVKKTLYPAIALREIIANALIHQDFTVTGAGPLVEIFDDRIEMSNPGTLLPSKRLDRLIGTQPESRNERLARFFRRYKICEERGSGLLKAGLEVEIYGLPPIRFETGSNFFKVTLFAPRSFAQMSDRERLAACYQHAVLKFLSSSAMTNMSLRERLKMPEKQRSMVSVLIQEAVDQNLIKPADPESKSKKFAEYVPYWA
jgi:ATP-dependent DNA helicase RecG